MLFQGTLKTTISKTKIPLPTRQFLKRTSLGILFISRPAKENTIAEVEIKLTSWYICMLRNLHRCRWDLPQEKKKGRVLRWDWPLLVISKLVRLIWTQKAVVALPLVLYCIDILIIRRYYMIFLIILAYKVRICH